MQFTIRGLRTPRRRGVVMVQVVVGLVLLFSVAALAVDVGMLYSIKADLQNAADAAALAGASGYFTDEGLIQDPEILEAIVKARVQEFGAENKSYQAGGTVVELADITLGYFDKNDKYAPLDTSGNQPFNAVQVTTRRGPDSSNGAILFNFARFFGMYEGGVTATAVAMIDDQFSGFDLEESSGPDLLPFTMYLEAYDYLLEHGDDDYSYNEDAEAVENEADGVHEMRVFPWKESGQDSSTPTDEPSDGSGNFGILDFGGASASVIAEQVLGGISPEDMEAVIGTSEPVYYDDDGNPLTYNIPGQPGMMTSIQDEFAERVGDIVSFFVHDQVQNPGANATFRNVGIRYGRLMLVQLTGNPNDRKLLIQPVAYQGGSVTVSDSAPSTGGQLGRITLVR